MDVGAVRYQGLAAGVGGGRCESTAARIGRWEQLLASLPVIEVCDDDYRSIAMPCHALEEGGDC